MNSVRDKGRGSKKSEYFEIFGGKYIQISLNFDIADEKLFYTAFMLLFELVLKMGRHLAQ